MTIGAGAVVGENVVLDIDTAIGDGATVGHASSLHRGQAVPAGETWQGSPARPTDTTFPTVAPQPCGWLRKVVYSLVSLTFLLAVLAARHRRRGGPAADGDPPAAGDHRARARRADQPPLLDRDAASCR